MKNCIAKIETSNKQNLSRISDFLLKKKKFPPRDIISQTHLNHCSTHSF